MSTFPQPNSKPLYHRPSGLFLNSPTSGRVILATLHRSLRPSLLPQPLPDGLVRGAIAMCLHGVAILVETSHMLVLPCALAAWSPIKGSRDRNNVDGDDGEEEERFEELPIQNHPRAANPTSTPISSSPDRKRVSKSHPLFLPLPLFNHTLSRQKLSLLVYHSGVLAIQTLPTLLIWSYLNKSLLYTFSTLGAPAWVSTIGSTVAEALILPLQSDFARILVSKLTGCDLSLSSRPSRGVSRSSNTRHPSSTSTSTSTRPSFLRSFLSRLSATFTLSLLSLGSSKSFSTFQRSFHLSSKSHWSVQPLHLLRSALAYTTCTALEGAWEMVLVRWAIQDGEAPRGGFLLEGWKRPWPAARRRRRISPEGREGGVEGGGGGGGSGGGEQDALAPAVETQAEVQRVGDAEWEEGDPLRLGGPTSSVSPPLPITSTSDQGDEGRSTPLEDEIGDEGQLSEAPVKSSDHDESSDLEDHPPSPPSVAPSMTTPSVSERLVQGSQASTTTSELGDDDDIDLDLQDPILPEELITTQTFDPESSDSNSPSASTDQDNSQLHSSQETERVQNLDARPLPPSHSHSHLGAFNLIRQGPRNRDMNPTILQWRSVQYHLDQIYSSQGGASHLFPPPPPPPRAVLHPTSTSSPSASSTSPPIISTRPTTLKPYPPNAFETLAIIIEEEGVLTPFRGMASKMLSQACANWLKGIAEGIWQARLG